MPKSKAVFITATDTAVGKTVVSCALGLALQRRGLDVGVMKPFQSSGKDTDTLIKVLGLKDEKELINPCYFDQPLAPYPASLKAKQKIDLEKVFAAYHQLGKRHEFLIVEGIGGLLVPIKKDYLVSDFIRDLDIPVIIVARAGLGTINHTLLTQKSALDYGLVVKGVIINSFKKKGIAEETNPQVLRELLDVPLLGRLPFIKNLSNKKFFYSLASWFEKNLNLDSIIKEEKLDTVRLIKQDKDFLWHPFTQMKDWLKDEPLIVSEAKGCYLKDTRGRWYLDGVSSLWVNIHGHRKREIDSAIIKQLNKVAHSTLLGLGSQPAIELAKEIIAIAPEGLAKVFYSDSGSTAVEIALKMAYQYWQLRGQAKTKFVHLENSYHGDTIGAVSVGGVDLFHNAYKNLLFESFKVDSPYCYRCPKGKSYPLCAFECLDNLKEVLRLNHSAIAAFIVEPLVQCAGGMLVWPPGIYKEIAKLCREYKVLLIADEVAVGFRRTGSMFASSIENVSPDILCLAKGITAGYLPLAATLTTKNIFDAFLGEYKEQKTFFHGHTYTGNPLAAQAALANLEIFRRERTLVHLRGKIEHLKVRLEEFKSLKSVGDIRQKGFIVGIELVQDKQTKEPYPWEEKIGVKVCLKARDYGVILRPLGDVIVLMPPLAISKEDLDKLLDVTYKAIRFITEKK